MQTLSFWSRVAAAITRFTAAVALRVGPALPWLFLALRRALIPTAVWLIVVALFFVVPQSREVLHGLSEPVLKSFTEFDPKDQTSINAWAFASYVITAVVVALAIWYSARLLATVESDTGTPAALASGASADLLRLATAWYPRGLGVSALAAAVGALIFANYTPQLSHLSALLLAGVAIAGPLLLAVGRLMGAQPAAARKTRPLLIVPGVVAMLVAAGWLVMRHPKWPVWLWSIGASVLPALMLVFLVLRRGLLQAVLKSVAEAPSSVRSFGAVVLTVVRLVLASGLVLLLLALVPPVVMRSFGSAASILLFLAAASLLLSGAQLVLRRFASNVPGFTAAVLIVIAVLVALIGSEDLGTEALDAKPKSLLAEAAPAPAPAASSTAATPAPRPIYVNAYGGGLRAAVFTAQVLARADDATCGRFGERVAAFSGVSGGSVGIATYLVARQEFKARGGWPNCTDGGAGPQKTPLADIVTGALVQDHLSAAIGRMLAVDAPHLWWAPVRGQALLDSLNGALLASLAAQYKGTGPDDFSGLALPLGHLSGGFATPPDVYFNASDADSGHITWFSNVQGGSAGTYLHAGQKVTASVGQAVLHSARFPLVTPAGEFRSPWAPNRVARLIDGGYADNSGTTRLLEVVGGANPPHGAAAEPRLVDIDGNPREDSPCRAAGRNPPILTAVQGLLTARTAHAARAVERFEQRTGAVAIPVRLDLEAAFAEPGADPQTICRKVERAEQAPLGWYMSYGAAATVARSARLGVDRICTDLALQCNSPNIPAMAQN